MPTFALVDAFADRAFTGNPAGVVLLDGPVDPVWAQLVAAEVRASETAFVTPADDGTFDLRWWTPTAEVDLCGHATLAAAHVLIGGASTPDGGVVRFHTRSGLLTVTRPPGQDTDQTPLLVMDLPAWAPAAHPEPASLATALGDVSYRYHGRNDQDQVFDLVEVADVATLLALCPDLDAVTALGGTGLIVTTAGDGGDGGADVVSRVFAPAVGVDEDPVTGSAHAVLGPWWSTRLGRDRLVADQRSARGGRLELHVTADRVAVAGRAVTVVLGVLHA